MKLEVAIQNAYQKLKNNCIKSALLDSELLLAETIQQSREFVILNSNYNISKTEYQTFCDMIAQRSKGKPVAYLTKKKYFGKMNFL